METSDFLFNRFISIYMKFEFSVAWEIIPRTQLSRPSINSTNLQKPERFFYLPKEIVQELKFQGNSNHFCLFSRICEIFRKFKKEICSRIVGSNFSRHYGIQKFQRCAENRKIHVFRTSQIGQNSQSGKHEFCDSPHIVGVFHHPNVMKSQIPQFLNIFPF